MESYGRKVWVYSSRPEWLKLIGEEGMVMSLGEKAKARSQRGF